MKTFILAMVLHPEVYRKVQAEMDRVVGPERLPDFEDREHLPYLECVLKEVFRYLSSLLLVSGTRSSHSSLWQVECSRPSRLVRGAQRRQTPVINSLTSCGSGVPHSASSPDIYRGFDVPEGSMIIPNIWCDDPTLHAKAFISGMC